MAAIHAVWVATENAPSRPSTGRASNVNPVSPASATTDQTTPQASVRPPPCTTIAPTTTTTAPMSSRAGGRFRASKGTTTASTSGTQATTVPITAGSA